MEDGPPVRNWFERLFSGPAVATILMALVGQAIVSIVYQIVNNEQQAATILANSVALQELKTQINEMRTPLSIQFFKLQDQLVQHVKDQSDLNRRIDQMDVVGTRALTIVTNNQARVMAQLDRLAERMLMMDKRIGEVDLVSMKIQIDGISKDLKKIEDQQQRLIQSLQPR